MYFLRPGGFQHTGGFSRRGAGGQDVVQQQYPLSGNFYTLGQPVDAQHTFRRRGVGVIPSSRPTAFASNST